MNSTGNATVCEPPSTALRIVGATFLFILNLIGAIAYGLIITILVSYRSQFKHPFYILEYHLTVCDCMLLLSVFLLVIPQTASGSVHYTPLLETIFTTLDTVSFNAIMMFTYIIAINRFMCFFWPRGLELFFNATAVHFVSLIPWVFGLSIGLITDLSDCPKIFRTCELVYLYVCKAKETPIQVSILLRILQIFGYAGPVLMALGYLAIFVRLRNIEHVAKLTDQQLKDFEREIKLLKQGTVIAAILLLECLAFWLLPGFFPTSHIASIFINSLSILNSAINPFIYLNFNSIMRQCVRALFSSQTSTEEIFVAPGILSPLNLVNISAHASHKQGAKGLSTGLSKGFSLIQPTSTLTAMQIKILTLDAVDLTESKA